MKTKLANCLAGIVCGSLAVMAGTVSAYEASRGPTELIYWDSEKAFPGYFFVRTRPSRCQRCVPPRYGRGGCS